MTSNQLKLHRRALLASVRRAGRLFAASSLLSAGPGILAPAAPLLSCRVYGQTGDLLVEPSEIRSQDGVLDTTLAAAAGMVQLGRRHVPRIFVQ